MFYLKNCKKTGEQKSFTNGERFFYAHFITSFKKFARARVSIKGQSILEYFIIITLVVSITAFGVSAFFNRSKDSADTLFKRAIKGMESSGSLSILLVACQDDYNYSHSPGNPCQGFENPLCLVNCTTCMPGRGAPPGNFSASIPPEYAGVFEGFLNDYANPANRNVTLTVTSSAWAAMSGQSLSPGVYRYNFTTPDNGDVCFFADYRHCEACVMCSGYPEPCWKHTNATLSVIIAG